MSKALVLANGDAPLKSEINFLKKKGYETLICSDGGANHARKLNIIPDLIIGDMDSISPENKLFFQEKCSVIQYKRQNDTDVEKSLKYLIKHEFKEVILLGGTGDRLDHTLCNLGIVLKFFEKIKVSILHRRSILSPYKGDFELRTVKDEIISLYAFSKNTKITSKGLKYKLNNTSLPFGLKESTSNVATTTKVTLRVSTGIVYVIRDFSIMKKYDLF